MGIHVFVYQNYYNYYTSLLRTRRYRMLIKVCKSTYNSAHLIFTILSIPISFNIYQLINLFSLSLSTFYFYKKLFIKNVGVLVNNLHHSYNFWVKAKFELFLSG